MTSISRLRPHGNAGRFRQLEWNPLKPAAAIKLGASLAEAAQPDPFLKAFQDAGLSPPVVPGAADAREEFVALLQATAEIEHALMVQYLYAWFTSGDDQQHPRNRTFQEVAVQEMGHLFTVQNLLRAAGERIHLLLPDPTMSPAQDAHPFPLHLASISRKLLAQYVTAESPLADTLPEPQRTQSKQAAQDAMMEVRHVGLLFLKLYWLAQPSKSMFGPWNPPLSEEWEGVLGKRHLSSPSFDTAAQRSWTTAWDVPMDAGNFLDLAAPKKLFVAQITNGMPTQAEQVCRLFYAIGTQGEGYATDPGHAGHNHESHFDKFLQLYNSWVQNGPPAGIVQTVPCPWTGPASSDPAMEASHITDPAAVILAQAFNLRYERILLLIALTFTQEALDSGIIPTIRQQAVGTEMRGNLVDLAAALLNRPAKSGGTQDDSRAGPPFQSPPIPDIFQEIRTRLAEIKSETESLVLPQGVQVDTQPDKNLLDLINPL